MPEESKQIVFLVCLETFEGGKEQAYSVAQACHASLPDFSGKQHVLNVVFLLFLKHVPVLNTFSCVLDIASSVLDMSSCFRYLLSGLDTKETS